MLQGFLCGERALPIAIAALLALPAAAAAYTPREHPLYETSERALWPGRRWSAARQSGRSARPG